MFDPSVTSVWRLADLCVKLSWVWLRLRWLSTEMDEDLIEKHCKKKVDCAVSEKMGRDVGSGESPGRRNKCLQLLWVGLCLPLIFLGKSVFVLEKTQDYVRIWCRILESLQEKTLFSKLLMLLCIVKGQEKKNPFDSFALVTTKTKPTLGWCILVHALSMYEAGMDLSTIKRKALFRMILDQVKPWLLGLLLVVTVCSCVPVFGPLGIFAKLWVGATSASFCLTSRD